MDTLSALRTGQLNAGRELMVFDWDKAAEIIAERQPKAASAGLSNDWEWTGGDIWRDGAPVTDAYTYLASTWATPELDVDGETIPCFRMQSATPGWGSDTKWPDSALAIVGVRAPEPAEAPA